jgi:hypothetical protein
MSNREKEPLEVNDAAGKAVAAGVVGQPREPFMPGSGARLPAELRLVLAGYVGVACGLFAGALACATALILFFLIADDLDRGDDNKYLLAAQVCRGWLVDTDGLLFGFAFTAFFGGLWRGLGLGLWRAFTRSRRVSDFPGCSGGPAIHARPR